MAYNPKYDDIIDRPHHVSRSHPRMPLSDRAFQFAPFAALSGYADTIRETQRLTESSTRARSRCSTAGTAV